MIIIWYPTGENTWAGNDYVNTRDIWRPLHGRINTALVAGAEVDWSFDGFHFDSFNRRYLLHEEHLPDEKVQEAMRLLESWAVDMGFTTPIRNEFSESSEFSP